MPHFCIKPRFCALISIQNRPLNTMMLNSTLSLSMNRTLRLAHDPHRSSRCNPISRRIYAIAASDRPNKPSLSPNRPHKVILSAMAIILQVTLTTTMPLVRQRRTLPIPNSSLDLCLKNVTLPLRKSTSPSPITMAPSFTFLHDVSPSLVVLASLKPTTPLVL